MVGKINTQTGSNNTKFIGKYFNQKPEKDQSQKKKTFKDSSFVESNPELIKSSIINQIHYYFSIENLCRDLYLRCNMNDEGWVEIPFLCSFNRMRSFDYKSVCEAVKSMSDHIELNEESDKIRIKSFDNRKLWILTEEVKSGFLSARLHPDTSNKNNQEGWETVKTKNHNHNHHHHHQKKENTVVPTNTSVKEESSSVQIFEFSDESSEELDFFSKERRNFDIRRVEEQQDDEEFYSADEDINYSGDEEDDQIDDDEELLKKLIIVTQSPFKKNKFNSRKYISNEIASIINDGLYFYEQDLKRKKKSQSTTSYSTVIVEAATSHQQQQQQKPQQQQVQIQIPTTGSAWGKSTPTMAQKLKEQVLGIPIESEQVKVPTRLYSPKPKSNNNSNNNNNNNNTKKGYNVVPIGWVVNSSDSANSSPNNSPKPTTIANSNNSNNGDIPFFQHPSYELLEENGFVQHKYDKYKSKCLKERKRLGIGNSSEMNTLFRFWSHFLRAHFIQKIYQEFLEISLEDAKQGAGYGMECVFRYFSYGLEKKFRLEVFNDFQTHTLQDYKTGSLYALEKFWAYLKYRKDQTPLDIIPELNQILSNFKHINDFRNHKLKTTTATTTTQKPQQSSSSNNNNSHTHYKKQQSSSSSSYQSNNNNNNSSMKSRFNSKSNSTSSSKSMMNNNNHGFM